MAESPLVTRRSAMGRPRQLVVAVAVVLALTAGLATFFPPAPAVDHSGYGYSVSVGTNATLTNVALVVPLPTAADGGSPVADSVRAGNGSVPAGWRHAVVERG